MGHHAAIVPYSTSVKALLSNTLEVVIFGEKSCNETALTTLKLVDAPLLRVVRIGGNSFCYAGSFVVKKLPVLEAVVVGEWCFAKRGNGTSLMIQDCPAHGGVCGQPRDGGVEEVRDRGVPEPDDADGGGRLLSEGVGAASGGCGVCGALSVGFSKLVSVRIGDESFANVKRVVVSRGWRTRCEG